MKSPILLQKVKYFTFFIIFLYIVISLAEWLSHYYLMHFNGFFKTFIEYFLIKLETNHIDHHKETRLDQTLPDDFIEEGTIFNLTDSIIVILLMLLLAYLFWLFFPGFKKSFSLPFILFFTFILANSYFYVWGSIHTHYHNRYIENNKPLKNNPKVTIYAPIPFFVPNESSAAYKYLLWYHTLHHLNKGQDKTHYNVLCPMFDHIFGTYKNHVDNTNYFSSKNPETPGEEWLKNHIVFDIRVLDNNILEYRDKGSTEWKRIPAI